MLLQTTTTTTTTTTVTSPFQSTTINYIYYYNNNYSSKNPTSCVLPNTFLTNLDNKFHIGSNNNKKGIFPFPRNGNTTQITTKATLLETPVLWVGRLCIYYALLKTGFAGSSANPLVSDMESNDGDMGFSKWFELQSKPEKEASDKRKLVSKWHPTTKGTLKRNYRVPSKSEGRRLLKAIASLLSDDDHFRDATSHKGCQIRRESAHGETVCCNNVRALFDELPTPHLVLEITPFPVDSLSEVDYAKAEKLERVLRSGPSV